MVTVEDAITGYLFPFQATVLRYLTIKTMELLFSALFSGKQVRTKLSQAFNHWLNVPEDKLQVRNRPFQAS